MGEVETHKFQSKKLPTKNYKKIINFSFILFFGFFLGIFLGYILSKTDITPVVGIAFIILFPLILQSIRLAFFLFLITIPLTAIWFVQILNAVIPLHYITGMLFVGAVICDMLRKRNESSLFEIFRTPIDLPLLLLFTVMILSILQTVYIPTNPPIIHNKISNYPWIKSISKILLLVGYISIFYAVQYILRTKEDIKRWFFIYMIISSVIALYGVIALVVYIPTDTMISIDGYKAITHIPDDLPRIRATELEPSFFGFYLMTIIPLALTLLIRQKQENRIVYQNKKLLIILSLTLLALFFSGSRAAILGFLFSLMTLFFIFKKKQPLLKYGQTLINELKICVQNILLKGSKVIKSFQGRIIILFSFFIIILLLSSHLGEVKQTSQIIIERGILAPTVGTFSNAYGKFWSTRIRLLTYSYALDAFQQHPWLGIGYENYNFYTGLRVYPGLLDINITWPEVNNYPLKVLTEEGILGFIALLFLIVTFFYHLIKVRNATTDIFLKIFLEGYIASFVGIGIILLFSSNITRGYLWVSMAMAVAITKIAYSSDNLNKQVQEKIEP